MQGWIKLYRELLEKPIWLLSTPSQKTVLITLLMLANHSGKDWEWQGEPYHLEPGQLITSLASLANKCGKGVSVQSVRSALLKFSKYGFLTNQSTKVSRLITIVNWRKYQGYDNKPTKQPTDSQQSSNKEPTTNKNVKNVKKKTLSSSTVPVTEIIEYLNQKTGKHFTTRSVATKKKINARWNEGHSIDEFKKVIDVKSAEWNGTDAAKWLRPETLFGTKFEAYLNEQPTGKPAAQQESKSERIKRLQKFVTDQHVNGVEPAEIQKMVAEIGANLSIEKINKIIEIGDDDLGA